MKQVMSVNCVAATVLVLAISAPATAEFNYPDFSDVAGLTLVGDASQVGNRLRLNPSATYRTGAAWYGLRQNVAGGFETTFQFQITDLFGDGADGFAFAVQNERSDAIGGTGHGIGYGNAYTTAGIANSIAVEFDTFWNTAGGIDDPSGNHVSIQTRSMLPNDPDHEYSLGSTSGIPILSDEAVHIAKIAYESELLEIYLDDLDNPVLTVGVDLSSLLVLEGGQDAWVGFTAATGDYGENHDILSWYFVPEPSSLLGFTVVISAFALRRAQPSARNLRD